MNVIGIVGEYNPFHFGHEYHIKMSRERLGEDSAVICAMSGDYVQRGEAAMYSSSPAPRPPAAAASISCWSFLCRGCCPRRRASPAGRSPCSAPPGPRISASAARPERPGRLRNWPGFLSRRR